MYTCRLVLSHENFSTNTGCNSPLLQLQVCWFLMSINKSTTDSYYRSIPFVILYKYNNVYINLVFVNFAVGECRKVLVKKNLLNFWSLACHVHTHKMYKYVLSLNKISLVFCSFQWDIIKLFYVRYWEIAIFSSTMCSWLESLVLDE